MEQNNKSLAVTGKVLDVLPEQSGTSATTGNEWKLQTFILELQDGQYTRKLAVEIFGEQRIKDNFMVIGGTYEVNFDLESRENNGRWYTSARAWKTTRLDAQEQQNPEPAPAQVDYDPNYYGAPEDRLPY